MKAWVLHDINDIRYEDVDNPNPAPCEVLVKIQAAGICGSDIPRIYSTGAHNMPLIPGHEFSGVVISDSLYVDINTLATQSSDKTQNIDSDTCNSWVGKRVGIFPLIPCKKCKPCLDGHYEMCRNYSYLGSRRDGAFAEYVSVPVWNLIELPDSVSFEEAAMLEPMSVAVHAMRIGLGSSLQNGSKGETIDANVIVCGLGTIGLLLTQFLLDAGCKNVFVIGNKDLQKSLAIKIGIAPDHFCDSRVEDVAKWLSSKIDGADLFFECVGRNECISLAVDSAAPGGRVVLVGNPYSDITFSRNVYWKILRNQLTVLGTWNSSFSGIALSTGNSSFDGVGNNVPSQSVDDWHYVLERLAAKKVNPSLLITHKYPLEQLDTGLHVMRDKNEEYCKVMITT